MENKKIKFDVHQDFKLLCCEIQNKRIARGMENSQEKVSLWKLTKTITNMIRSNDELIEALVGVKINGN